MTLEEISRIISTRSPYPLISITDDHDGVVAVIGHTMPDDSEAISSLYFSRLQLTEATYPDLFIAARVDEAAAGLSRYLQSLAPVPKWDSLSWGA